MYTDATLACDGQFYPVHKFILSTCSEFLCAMFEWTPCVNPVIVMNYMSTKDLESLLDFMYTGSASVKESELDSLVKAAQHLRIHGLACLDSNIKPVMHKEGSGSSTNSLYSSSANPEFQSLRDLKKSPDSRLATEPPSKKRKSDTNRLDKPLGVSLPSISSLAPSTVDTKPSPQFTQMQQMSHSQAAHSQAGLGSKHVFERVSQTGGNQSALTRAHPGMHQQIHSQRAASQQRPQSEFSHFAPANNRQLQQLLSAPRSPSVENQLRQQSPYFGQGKVFPGGLDSNTLTEV